MLSGSRLMAGGRRNTGECAAYTARKHMPGAGNPITPLLRLADKPLERTATPRGLANAG